MRGGQMATDCRIRNNCVSAESATADNDPAFFKAVGLMLLPRFPLPRFHASVSKCRHSAIPPIKLEAPHCFQNPGWHHVLPVCLFPLFPLFFSYPILSLPLFSRSSLLPSPIFSSSLFIHPLLPCSDYPFIESFWNVLSFELWPL